MKKIGNTEKFSTERFLLKSVQARSSNQSRMCGKGVGLGRMVVFWPFLG